MQDEVFSHVHHCPISFASIRPQHASLAVFWLQLACRTMSSCSSCKTWWPQETWRQTSWRCASSECASGSWSPAARTLLPLPTLLVLVSCVPDYGCGVACGLKVEHSFHVNDTSAQEPYLHRNMHNGTVIAVTAGPEY